MIGSKMMVDFEDSPAQRLLSCTINAYIARAFGQAVRYCVRTDYDVHAHLRLWF